MQNNTVYSDIESINTLIKSSIDELIAHDYKLKEIRNINYGTRYKFTKDNLIYSFTVYYSSKKGISIVKDQNINQSDFDKFLSILNLDKDTKEEDENYNKWIGTDEAGKGDYFGPLVVAGFVIDRSEKDFINSIGIKDSKCLSDGDVEKLYQKLEDKYLENISVQILMPFEYNKTISQLKEKGQTLNDLLGKLHSQVILELYEKHKEVEGVITDQFTHQDKVYSLIKDSVKANYTQRTKAENDIAVATASVIARAIFLRKLIIIGEEYKTVFPKGASNQVTSWAANFCKTYGEDKLNNVAKIHFKTTNNVINILRG